MKTEIKTKKQKVPQTKFVSFLVKEMAFHTTWWGRHSAAFCFEQRDLGPAPARSRGYHPQGVSVWGHWWRTLYSISQECWDLADSDTRPSQGANEDGQVWSDLSMSAGPQTPSQRLPICSSLAAWLVSENGRGDFPKLQTPDWSFWIPCSELNSALVSFGSHLKHKTQLLAYKRNLENRSIYLSSTLRSVGCNNQTNFISLLFSIVPGTFIH